MHSRDTNTVVQSATPPPLKKPPIVLRRQFATHNWLRKTPLIAETLSIDHLGHLPKLLKPTSGSIEIKYIGGLRVLLEFGDSITAKEFKDNPAVWKEYIKHVEWGVEMNLEFERIAWIRIVELPLQLWGEKNFEEITRGFGRTIAPFNEIHHRIDLSCVKIGIMTSRKSRINEEVQVVIEKKLINMGIIEFDEDYWFPFLFDPRKNFLVDAYGKDVASNEPQASVDKEDELENGEIPADKEPVNRTQEAEKTTTETIETDSDVNNTNQEMPTPTCPHWIRQV
ncbi:hypothetical protein LXL04_023363 [Taraxacum kok-saghyz]